MAFEDFVNTELPLRVSTAEEPTIGNYLRYLGFGAAGLGVEELTPAQVLADIGAAEADNHAASHENAGGDEISVAGLSGELADNQNPTAHATEHVDGTDDIRDATTAVKGISSFAAADFDVAAGAVSLEADVIRDADFNDHSARHENAGADEISVAGLSGELADNQPPKTHAAAHQNAGGDEINVVGLSGLLADNQNPTAHAAEHTDGTDDIQNATAAQKGVATAAQITKLDGIEALADVTDAANVAGAGAVMDSDISPGEGFIRKTGAGAYTAHKSNLGAAVAPDADNDTTEGYTVGSVWIDTTADKTYICVDNTDTAAVWNDLTAGGGLTDIVDDATPQLGGTLDSNGNPIAMKTTDKLTFHDNDIYIHATADGNLLVRADTLLTLGIVGTTEFGDGTLRVARPNTDLKIDLGDVTHYFNNAYIKAVQSLAGSGVATYLHGGVIDVDTATVGNAAGGALTTLITYVVPADTLATNGDSLEFICAGEFANVATNQTIQFITSGGGVYTQTVGATAATHWWMHVTVIRTGANTQRCIASFVTDDTTMLTEADYATAADDTTGAITYGCRGAGTGANDVEQHFMKTIFHPAP